MSTRCYIAAKSQDKEGYDYIYCHFDGGQYVRSILDEHYTDEAKVRALISLGNISQLRERVSPNATEKHSFKHPVDGVTVAYARDRGECDQEADYAHTRNEMIRSDVVSYVHVFEEGKWTTIKTWNSFT